LGEPRITVVDGNSTGLTAAAAVTALLAFLVLCLGFSLTLAGQEAQAIPSAVESVDAHVGRGYEALKQENYDQAASEFRAALALDPKLVLKARFPLAVALFEMHKSDDARGEFEAVRKEVGDHPNVLYYLGRLDIEDRNFPDAIRNLNKAVTKPPFPDTAYYLGFSYLQQGNLTAAEKWLKEAARLLPRDSRIPYQLGSVYRKQGRTDDARKALALSSELRQHDNKESQLKVECGQKLDQAPREEAHAFCDQLYDPDNAEKLTALGTIYGQHRDLEAALKPFQRAAELAPHSPQMQYNLALTYYQLNRAEQARAPLEEGLKRWPDLFQLNFLYGAVLLKLGDEPAAYDALHHANQLNPKDKATVDLLYPVTLELAQKSQAASQYPNAIRHLEEAVKLRPGESGPHRKLADVYTLLGQSERATAERQEADRLAQSSGR
jgi:tetratricopeptide (TPR) repeat protein